MRLLTFEHQGHYRAGARLDDGRVLDLNQADNSIPADVRELLAAGEPALAAARQAIGSAQVSHTHDADVRIAAPVRNPEKVICIGLNYADHAAETGMPIPEEPVVFSKFASTLIGPGDTIQLPDSTQEVDYEAELVAVIGTAGRHISESDAMGHIAGYTVGHDVSARDYQLQKPGGQWLLGKTFDTFAPLGPEIVTADEIDDPHNLSIRCILNGETMQDSNTNQLIYKLDVLVSYLSHVITLQPGDLIFTGTPPGVGMGRDPKVWLKSGDTVACEVEGIGRIENPVK